MTVTEKLNGYGPLAGIKVVEMCTYVAAPATVRVLSEMGAEVIKIESFAGDTQRTQGPGFGCELTDTEDPTIDLNNTNKNWVSLNLKDPEGLAIAKKMIGEADIFMNNMRTAALKKLGLDYPTLSAEFPGLIWAQMRGYGEFGEFAHAPGYDAVCWAARGGVAGTFPEKDTSPAIPPQAFGDYNTAIMMAAGLLGALVNKLRTGQGDKVVVNLYHSAIWGGSIGLCAQQFGADYPKSRTDVPNPFNNTYKTADDKWLYICQPQHNRYYNDMMKIIGRDDLVDDPRYATIENVKANHLQPELITILDEGFSKKDLNRASRRGKKLQDLLLTAIHGMIEWWQQNPAGGGRQREAYTMKIRSGCDGGGKGPLVQEELSATLATHQDQTLFELRNTVLNDQGGGFMEVTHGITGTLRAQEHGHAPITFDKTEGNEKT